MQDVVESVMRLMEVHVRATHAEETVNVTWAHMFAVRSIMYSSLVEKHSTDHEFEWPPFEKP